MAIDSVLVLGMALPPIATGLTFSGAPVTGSTGQSAGQFVQRGTENYAYTVTGVTLARADAGPPLLGTNAPSTWWTPGNASDANVNAQLALLTWEPDPATKAIEKTELRKDQIKQRWQTVCEDAAPPARVLWTFLDERLGPSAVGWDLEGIAWPDPPQTRRKTPPRTDMLVTEAWRSGDPHIDALRGILPATVVGAKIKCPTPNRPPIVAGPALAGNIGRMLGGVAFDPVVARRLDALLATPNASQIARVAALSNMTPTSRLIGKALLAETLPDTAVDPASVLSRLNRGEAVSRQEIGTAFLGQAAAAGPVAGTPPNCQTRVLQSPMFDDGRLIVFGDPARHAKDVQTALAKAGIKHGPLNDVVVLHTGAITDAVILLFVRRNFLEGNRLVARTLDAHGNELSRVAASATNGVASHPLPPRWTDPTGPWSDDVQDVLGWTQDPRASGYLPIWLLAKGDKQADRIEIGLVDTAANDADRAKLSQAMGLIPPYYVGAIDAQSFAEIDRADSEQTEITKERQILTQILGPGATDDAYLVPNQLYKVTTAWSGARQSDGKTIIGTQNFWFRTDGTPPAHLEPWVLLTTPADSEAHAFRNDPVQIVFNTHNVDRLFAAYGKELRIRFTASSANHPPSTPAVPHPFPIVATKITPAKAGILSPWEDAIQEVVAEQKLTCIPVDIDRTRQSQVSIPILLDPFTDYRMDVMMVDIGAPQTTEGTRIYRRVFSTGAYDTMTHFANDMQSVKVTHRALDPGKIGALRVFFNGRQPQGAEFDEQLRLAGMEAPDKAPGARILVIWEQTGPGTPQPVAVLLDAPEPMWRARPHPEKITDTSGLSNAQRWVLGSRDWMVLQQGATTDAPLAANGFIRVPGDQRALVVLAPGARGKRFSLDLVLTASTDAWMPIAEERHVIVDLTLTRAPWEE